MLTSFGGNPIRGFPYISKALVSAGVVNPKAVEGTLDAFEIGMVNFLPLKVLLFPGIFFLT